MICLNIVSELLPASMTTVPLFHMSVIGCLSMNDMFICEIFDITYIYIYIGYMR